ncbi:hypothetical protein [Brucella rhizosphaerae]|nr:hypothetical protein [Brucella rhizosphaerae]
MTLQDVFNGVIQIITMIWTADLQTLCVAILAIAAGVLLLVVNERANKAAYRYALDRKAKRNGAKQ